MGNENGGIEDNRMRLKTTGGEKVFEMMRVYPSKFCRRTVQIYPGGAIVMKLPIMKPASWDLAVYTCLVGKTPQVKCYSVITVLFPVTFQFKNLKIKNF